jgi:quinolinate synthase
VFCGVHFMAEVADILSRPEQISILPDLSAGCSMADMANLAKVERAWRELAEAVLDPDRASRPVTYINSAADLKAFCGRHGGIVCTSSNARAGAGMVLRAAREGAVLPRPASRPQHRLPHGHPARRHGGVGFRPAARRPDPGADPQGAKMILWKGFCSVHQMFKPEHIDAFRKAHPEGKVISHPECSFEVCQKSDYVGSTEYIIKTIAAIRPARAGWSAPS